MALLLQLLPFAVSISVSSAILPSAPSSLVTATIPPELSAPPAWAKNEAKACSSEFSRGKLDPWDCLQALTKVPSGSTPIRLDRNAPKGAANSLPFYAIHGEYALALLKGIQALKIVLHMKKHARSNSKLPAAMHLALVQFTFGHPKCARWCLS